MLTTNISSVPQFEINVDFTLDDFLQFYRSIASQSYQKCSVHHGALTLVREKLFRYVSSLTQDNVSLINFTAMHRKMLVEQVASLLQKNIINSSLDPKKMAAMIQDIFRNGEILKVIIMPDDKDAMLGYLTNINDECQATVPVANLVPVELKSGVSKIEQNTIVYGVNYFSSLPAISLYNKGLEKIKQQEWQDAVEFFQQAVAAEYQIAEEFHQPANISNIYLYNRNIAYAFHMAGFSLQQAQNYAEAITTYNKSIVEIQAIPANARNAHDPETSMCCHRDIAICENYFANSFFDADKLPEAIVHYKLAISELDKIPDASHNDFDSGNVSIYKRNLAFAFNKQGHQFFEQKKFAEAQANYESAELVMASINADWRQENDPAMQRIYQSNKDLAEASKGMTANNRNAFFNQSNISSAHTPKAEHQDYPHKKRRLQ